MERDSAGGRASEMGSCPRAPSALCPSLAPHSLTVSEEYHHNHFISRGNRERRATFLVINCDQQSGTGSPVHTLVRGTAVTGVQTCFPDPHLSLQRRSISRSCQQKPKTRSARTGVSPSPFLSFWLLIGQESRALWSPDETAKTSRLDDPSTWIPRSPTGPSHGVSRW